MPARGGEALLAFVLVLAGVAGCLGDDPARDTEDSRPENRTGVRALPTLGDPLETPPEFQTPSLLPGSGFEPSIEIGPEGTIYITAPIPNSADANRDASQLWVSRDGGSSWDEPAGYPPEPGPPMAPFEGDIAVDPRGWLYFLDTYDIDNVLSAWSDEGKTQEHTRPVQGTATRDDRPWTVALGEGTLLYMGNNVYSYGPGEITSSPRQWIYLSTDAGRSWEPVFGIPETTGLGWATIDAVRGGTRAAVAQVTDDMPPGEVRVFVSENAGLQWNGPRSVQELEAPLGPQSWPVVAVGPSSLHVAWTEKIQGPEGNVTRLLLASSTDDGRSWAVTGTSGRNWTFAYPWVSVGSDGRVGVSVYGSPDLPLRPDSSWFLLAGTGPIGPDGAVPIALGLADPTPVAATSTPDDLKDFHQNAFGPEGTLHVAYEKETEEGSRIGWVQTS